MKQATIYKARNERGGVFYVLNEPNDWDEKKTVDLPDGVSYEVTPIGAALFSDLAPLGDDRLYLSEGGESLVCVFSSDVVTVICPAF